MLKQLAGVATICLLFPAQALFAQVEAESTPSVNRDIARLLSSRPLVLAGEEILAQDIILDMYRENNFAPYWTQDHDVDELIEMIETAPDHGLNPADYGLRALRSIQEARDRHTEANIRAEDEILLTESLLRYGYHRRFGKVMASKLDPNINFRREAFRDQPPGSTLRQLLEAPSMEPFIEQAAPSGPYYRHLQFWLAHYRDLADAGGWQPVPEGATLRKGDSAGQVAQIRSRLAVTGDLPAAYDNRSREFDAGLTAAVKAFQARHGLDADGIIGRQTLAAMNVPIEYRIDQLRASLERLRWVNQEAADTVVAVNIAGYRVYLFRDGELEWQTRAMVGKAYRQTPVFRGDMTYMEFNPTWTIPPGILRNDTLPAIKRDPGYLASKNIRVIDRNGKYVDPYSVDWSRYSTGVPYTLRQDPGPDNALGRVKFIFPNKHFVFLHDTPSRELFDRPERAFSSGCIRVEDPFKFAELLLDDPEKYPRSRLEAIVDSRKTQRVVLEQAIPVVIVYLTAALDISNNIAFYKDIYSRDQEILEALDGPVVINPPAPTSS